MDIKDCEIIKILSQELNLTKTAEILYTSQPALTYRLNKLEEELEIQIFKRNFNGITLTKEGKFLADYSQKILFQFENMKKQIKILTKEENKSIHIGVSTTLAKYKIAQILHDFKELFPNIKFEIFTGTSSSELPNLLKKDIIDLALFRGDEDWKETKYIIEKEPYGIITHIPFKKDFLNKIPYIQHETKTIVKSKIFLDQWKKENLDKEIDIIKVNSIEASLEMVRAGLGWTVLPKIHIQNFPELYFFPLLDINGTPFIRETYLLTKEKNLENKNINLFVEFICKNENKYFDTSY